MGEQVSQDLIAGKYNIIKLLGEGSGGKVYLVQHAHLGVKYALKILEQGLSNNSKFIERFKREAEVILKFSHESSIQLRDFGRTADGLYYMAMDYCEGQVLKKVIQARGAFGFEDAMCIIMQLLSVLDAAHSQGIIHRDIKPDNIMLEKNSKGEIQIKVLDFGIAKIKESVETDMNVTTEGASVGTPYYMSPEQASGESDFDHRVDIYSAGIVLYELLTGTVPYKGKTVLQTLLMHLTHHPEEFARRMGVPIDAEQIVFKAMQKLKDERYQTAGEFRQACLKAIRDFNEHPELQALQPIITETPEVKPEKPESKKTKILCLDDNEMILNIMKHILDMNGYEVFTAHNCSLVHDYVFNEKVDLLISDVEMPDMRGTKVCQMLKKSVPELKIILFSNIDERDLEKQSKESRADGWVSKNLKPADWLRKITEVLDAPA